MEKISVKKNFIFQVLYQLIIFVLPLVISPYLTRVLEPNNLGTYTFTYSIAYYFVVAANLGISKYGQRLIASKRNSEITLRKAFWSLFYLHLIISFFSLLCYIIVSLLQADDRIVYIIQGLYVASALFDITWLFYGLENFKSVVIKNLIIKILSTILIFVFVKDIDDLNIYTFIMAGSTFLGQLIMLPQAISIIKPIKISLNDMKEHLKPLLVLSIAVIAATLYTVFDKTLIGIMIDKEYVSFYEYASKIIMIPSSVLTVIGTVLFPRSCACYARGDQDGMKKYFKYSLLFTYFISFASIIGLISISDLFVYEYYGEKFMQSAGIIKALTPVILIISIGDIVRTQFLIPANKDKEYILIAIINAIVNIILSISLIPVLGVYGAVIGTISAEFIGTILQVFICRKNIDFKMAILNQIPFLFAAIAMYFILELVKKFYNIGIFALLLQVFLGFVIYTVIVAVIYYFVHRKKIKSFIVKKSNNNNNLKSQ